MKSACLPTGIFLIVTDLAMDTMIYLASAPPLNGRPKREVSAPTTDASEWGLGLPQPDGRQSAPFPPFGLAFQFPKAAGPLT